MKRKIKTAVLLFMVALLPMRALAAVTTDVCALAHDHGAAAQHGSADRDSHGPDAPSHSHDTSPCSSCVEHCSSAALAPFAPSASFAAPATTERAVLHERSVASFIPDHLDPPPLAL